MHPMDPIDAREAEIAKIAESKEDIATLQQHVTEIVEGAAFKGSHRSGQFLKYIVDQSIAGHFESLKERVIGMELFGRSPSYDTGEDAIVRVTASDVRKRLLQHYGKYGTPSEFRLRLPLGSYIPEITREGHGVVGQFDALELHQEPAVSARFGGSTAGASCHFSYRFLPGGRTPRSKPNHASMANFCHSVRGTESRIVELSLEPLFAHGSGHKAFVSLVSTFQSFPRHGSDHQ